MRGCKRRSNQIARHRRRATSLKDVRYTQLGATVEPSYHNLVFPWLSGAGCSYSCRTSLSFHQGPNRYHIFLYLGALLFRCRDFSTAIFLPGDLFRLQKREERFLFHPNALLLWCSSGCDRPGFLSSLHRALKEFTDTTISVEISSGPQQRITAL